MVPGPLEMFLRFILVKYLMITYYLPGSLLSMRKVTAKQNPCPHETSPMTQWVKNPPAMQEKQEIQVDPWVGKIPWRKKWQPTPVSLPENPMDRGAWWATVQRVAESRTWLSTHTPTHEAYIWERMTTPPTNKLEGGSNKFHKSIKWRKQVYIGWSGGNQVWANIWVKMREGNIHRAKGRTFEAKSTAHTHADTGCSWSVQAALLNALFLLIPSGQLSTGHPWTGVLKPGPSPLLERCPLYLQAEHLPPSERQPAVRELLCFQD